MATDADKDLALAYLEAFRTRDRGWWESHIAPGFVRHDPGLGTPTTGRDTDIEGWTCSASVATGWSSIRC